MVKQTLSGRQITSRLSDRRGSSNLRPNGRPAETRCVSHADCHVVVVSIPTTLGHQPAALLPGHCGWTEWTSIGRRNEEERGVLAMGAICGEEMRGSHATRPFVGGILPRGKVPEVSRQQAAGASWVAAATGAPRYPQYPSYILKEESSSCRAFEVCEDSHGLQPLASMDFQAGTRGRHLHESRKVLHMSAKTQRRCLKREESSAVSSGVHRSTRKGATKWPRYRTGNVCTSTIRFQGISKSRRNVI